MFLGFFFFLGKKLANSVGSAAFVDTDLHKMRASSCCWTSEKSSFSSCCENEVFIIDLRVSAITNVCVT